MLSCTSLNKLLYASATATTSLAGPSGLTIASLKAATSMSSLAPSTGAPSDTPSELSSADSDWSDIRAIATRLGVPNPDDLHTERFKVDRQKLEQMIKAESNIEGMNGAEYFFENAMKTTDTFISWPCRLKIGAKSKKDPHVRIVGIPRDVQRAKEHILNNLDSRGTRVIMKMDVSYTDHSYIIGRGGNNIKRIMETTSTHIHFPDSNRSNPSEKSNQVSLCGSLEGVERARALVRLSTPLLISFELPVVAAGLQQPDRDTPYIKMVETKYNVQVIFSTRSKLHSALVLVKGAEKEAKQVQEATQLLINFSCENVASQIRVNMQLEISPQHHEIVKGKNNSNLLGIMERTNTKIIFPDLSDMNVKPLKKSQVTITGTIDSVYVARQQLLGNLPTVLIFDFPENQNSASDIINLSTKYGVYISLRQKQRQSTLSIIIKGVEKYIAQMYEARHDILNLKTPLIRPVVPETYFAPHDRELTLAQRTALTSLLAGYPDSPVTPNNGSGSNIQLSPYGNNNNSLHKIATNNNNNTNTNNNNLLIKNNPPLMGFHGLNTSPPGICVPTQKYLQMHNNSFTRQAPQPPQSNTNNNYLQAPPLMSSVQPQPPQSLANPTSPRNSYSHNTSGYQSFSSSTTSLEQSYPPFGNANNLSNMGNGTCTGNLLGLVPGPNGRPHYSPDSTFQNEFSAGNCGRLARRSSDGVLLGLNASGPTGSLLPGSADSYRDLDFDLKHNRTFDIDMKRALGFKAMERPPVSGEQRLPNPNWMGMALSRTSPAPLETVDDTLWGRRYGGNVDPPNLASPYSLGVTTGLVDATPTNRRMQLAQYKDIHTLLTTLGLEHYIKTFVMNEIDLEMFSTLTEENLMELGITAFGARKKMLVAIFTLQANEALNLMSPGAAGTTPTNATSPRFSGSAAPGAERRPSNQW